MDNLTDPNGFVQQWFAERTEPLVGLRIARMRRGKRVVIPPERREQINHYKHRSRHKPPRELTLQELRAPRVDSPEWD